MIFSFVSLVIFRLPFNRYVLLSGVYVLLQLCGFALLCFQLEPVTLDPADPHLDFLGPEMDDLQKLIVSMGTPGKMDGNPASDFETYPLLSLLLLKSML